MVLWAMLASKAVLFSIGAVIAFSVASPALGCAVVIPRWWGPREFLKMARDAVKSTTVIIDGEVIRPYIEGEQNALVRAERVLKGPQQTEFEVGERDSCSIALTQVGERRRMLLVAGPDVYDLQYDGSNARYEDQILKSDRRKVWPFRAGAQAAQPLVR